MSKQNLLKKEIADLKRYLRYFWHNEFTMEMYGMAKSKEESQKAYYNAFIKLSKLEKEYESRKQ